VDLNQIEHVEAELKHHLEAYDMQPFTKEELEQRITAKWYKFI
jgi:hypothetical protein